MSQNAAAVKPAVPFLDLSPVHEHLREEILADLGAVIDSNAFVNGPAVAAFESAFASYCGVEHCVGLASGLDALRIALMTQEFEPGDEVIVPANTFFATFEAITQAGLRPVPVDASELDYCLDAGASRRGGWPSNPCARTRPPLRAGRGHGGDHRVRGAARIRDARGCGPGPRGRARRCQVGNLGLRRRLQLLSWQEPRCDGGCRGSRHRQRSVSRLAPALCASMASAAKYIPRMDRVHRSAGHHASGRPAPQAPASRRVERETRRGRRLVLRGAGRGRRPPPAARCLRASAPVWHLYVVRTRQPEALGAFLAEQGIGSGATIPSRRTCRPRIPGSAFAEGSLPGDRGAGRASASRCRSTRASTKRNWQRVCSVIEEYFARGR